MRTRCRATIEDLRQAIDCLPRHTRIAMLEGISANDIIVGAYATGDGICPMLAAHRDGGRTSLIAFAQAWDRSPSGHARPALPAGPRSASCSSSAHLEAACWMSRGGDVLLDEVGLGVSTNAGHRAVDLIPSVPSSLFIASVKPTTAALVAE